jgi:MFS family permease
VWKRIPRRAWRPALRPSPTRLTVLICALLFLDIALWLSAVPLLPRWKHDLGLTKREAGIVLGAYSFSVLVASLPLGRIADRVGAKRVTVAAGVLFALAAPTLGFANAFWQLVPIRIAQGLFSATTWTAGIAWIVASVPPDRRARSLAYVNATASAGSFAGPALGGPLVSALGLKPVFLGYGCVVAVFVLWALCEPETADSKEPRPSTRRELELGFRSSKVRTALLAILFTAAASGTVQLLAPLHLSAAGLSNASIGWVFTATAVASLTAMLFLVRLAGRIDRLQTMAWSAALIGVGHALLATTPLRQGYVATIVGISLVSSPLFVFAYALCAAGAEEVGAGAGVVIGSLNTTWAAATLAAPIAAGALSSAVADALPYGVVAGVAAATALVLARTRRTEVEADLAGLPMRDP